VIDKLKIDCRYDKFHDRIIIQGHESGVKCSGLNSLDNVALKVRQTVLERFGFDPTTVLIQDALRMRCLDNVFDPVLDYLDGLVWDGKPRLGGWLVHYCGAKDTELNREIGQKMLIAAVRRVRSPGCKFDYIVVLEGSQGVGKSTVLKLLAGDENFSDAEIIGSDKREQLEAVQGVWIYEIAELDGLHKSEVTKVKTVDSARPAYGRAREDRPRRGIFVATTNEDTYLRDETGNRRFWPVRILKVDLDAVARDRDQLWAEAAAAEASGEQLVISEHLWAEAATAQRARMEIDPWHDVIAARLGQFEGNAKRGGSAVGGQFAVAADHLGNPEWRVSSDYLLTSVLEISKDRQTNNHTKRLAAVMRSLGWSLSEGTIRIGKPCRGYTKAMPEQPIEATPEPAHELIENQAKPIPKIPVAPAFVRRI
jgi:predicted P-loop ATPase